VTPPRPDRFCAVIPALNEAARIAPVVEGARRHVDAVVVVDDGSSDDTAAVAAAAGAHVVRHPTNLGKGRALNAGIRWAVDNGFDAVITLDADGQHLAVEIPRFTEAYSRHKPDIILGTRMGDRRGMPLVRAFTNFLTSAVISCAAGRRISDSQSGYRLLKCSTACLLPLKGSRFDAEPEILVKACRRGLTLREVAVSTVYGDEVSKIHPLRDTLRFITLMLRLIFLER
jgi:glycosyltransferase involved in cell wall biosynthesis